MNKDRADDGNQWTILTLLKWTADFLKSNQIENPRTDSEVLLAHSLSLKRIDLYLRYDQPLTKNELAEFKSLLVRRVRREPVAYITGKKEFWSMNFSVTPEVLIPRPDTEVLVEAALGFIDDRLEKDSGVHRILELGTGSGAVIASLAAERPDNKYFASDISYGSVKIARENTESLKTVQGCVEMFCADLFKAIRPGLSKFDLILSNPPYIPTDTIGTLVPEITEFEPFHALDGGKDGSDILKKIIFSAPDFLRKNGGLILEMGYDQRNKVKELAEECGFYEGLKFLKDYGGNDRVAMMTMK